MKENFNIVIVGHVDHGKSTLVGRLYADTNSLPDGKLEEIKKICELQGKEFEYAFLFDALLEEQEQGITIDTARTFFSWEEREYILIDAPGHKEFLKNMISGAARAEASLLLIDAHEGVKAQSKQHGYMLSLLGINQVCVVINKMDLVGYKQETFNSVTKEYKEFLAKINVKPIHFIPVSAKQGDNIASKSEQMSWYDGPTVLESLKQFAKKTEKQELPLRYPVQDIYKFDARRIVAGRITSGQLKVGDKLVFSPSNKTAVIKSVEAFNVPVLPHSAKAGQSIGITLNEQIFIERGEIASSPQKAPILSSAFRCNIFWMGKKNLKQGNSYTLRLSTREIECRVATLHNVLDATNLSSSKKDEVVINDVAEITIRTKSPIAFDLYKEFEDTGRFVLVDEYDVSGGGIIMHPVHEDEEILLEVARRRDFAWLKGDVSLADRAFRHGHREGIVIFTSKNNERNTELAKKLEMALFKDGRNAYLLAASNLRFGIDADISADDEREMVRRFGETAHILMQTGMIITSSNDSFSLTDMQSIRTIVHPGITVTVNLTDDPTEKGQDKCDLEFAKSNSDDEVIKGVIEKLHDLGMLF